MKKSIFLFFAAILCAMTANAQLYLRGGFNDWGTGDKFKFVSNVCEIELAGATTYEFKISDSGWSSQFGGNLTFTATATKTLTSNGGNMKITTTIPGTYKFEFVQNTKKLTVTYPEVPAPHDITVRAKLPATWTSSTITAWVWTSENASGTKVTAEKDGDYYKITKNAGALYVIFRNGADWNGDKNQTVDLVYTEDVCLQLNQSGSAKATATVIDCGAVSKDITVKAVVPGAWENTITAWVWPTGGEGKEVTPTKDGNWYVVTENCIELNVIFKNGTGWNGNENQTANITGVSENTCYQISALNKDGEGKCTYTVVDCEAAIEPEAKPIDVYTIVGAETLVGTDWDVNNTDNDMTKQGDGSYVLVKENVELATTGTYEYKVVKNRSWDWKGVNEGNNLTLTGVDVDGTYNVTFTLNKELNALTTSLELVEAKKVIPECYVAGDESLTGQDWNAKSVSMTYDEATEVYTATLTAVPAGTHNMKVVYGGEWLGFDHLATPAPANVKEGEDKKIQFTLAEAGDVTVTYHATNGIGLIGNFAAPVTYDYYIAGTLAGGWSATQQGMIKDGDLYKAIFSELPADTYQFKITDGQWNTEEDKTHEYTTLGADYEEVSIVEGNVQIVTEEAINLTVIFDGSEITFDGLTEKTINYVDIKFTITANSAPQIHYWGDGITTGTDWNNLPSMTSTGNLNEYTFTIENVDQEKGVNYLLKIGELQTPDQSTKTDVVADFKDLLPLISIYGIVDWNAANAIHLTIADDYATATANIELAAETTYVFKVNIGDKWLGNKGTMTSDNCTGWTFAEKDGEEDMPNAGITTTIAGEYTFTWNVADNKLSVTYPTLPTPEVIRTGLTAGNYYTICMNKEMEEIQGATLWSFYGKDANFAYLVQENAPYDAGKAYIMYAEAEIVSAILTGEPASAPVANGAIHGTFDLMEQPALNAAGDNIYLVIGNQLRRVDGQTGNSLPANRAYVDIDEITGGAPAGIPANRVRSMPMQPQVATGMENVDASAQPVKMIIDGQLYILRGEKMYDAQGKLVK